MRDAGKTLKVLNQKLNRLLIFCRDLFQQILQAVF